MTIASCRKDIQELVEQHSVYGIETIMKSIVYADADLSYERELYLISILQCAYTHERQMILEDLQRR